MLTGLIPCFVLAGVMTKPKSKVEQNKPWVKSGANLIRYTPSGMYFARVRVNGKLYRESLKTAVMSVAKLKLADYVKDLRNTCPTDKVDSDWNMGNAIDLFEARQKCRQDIKESSKEYRRKCLDVLLKTWTGFKDAIPRRITKDECLGWAREISHYSPTVYNACVDSLRMLLALAMEVGARANNPAVAITKKPVKRKELTLPEPAQFEAFVKAMEDAGGRFSKDCADLVRFLAYGGFRVSEASKITWSDCDLDRGEIRVRGDNTKNGETRYVPVIPEMKSLLLRLRAECPQAKPEDPIMLVARCEEAMTRAAKKVGMKRIVHHDLRHLFVTRCVECGIDIPTVSRFIGHKDGGYLAMKTYGHLRRSHSVAMAQKVTFSIAPAPPASTVTS